MGRPVAKPVIVCDTREQCPLSFSESVEVVVDTLHTGDYSLAGATDRVALERKSLDDLVGTLVTAYWRKDDEPPKRFERELERMRSFDLRAVIVEASLTDLAKHRYVSMTHPSSVFGAICSIHANYGVPFIFAETRAVAGRLVERLITAYAHKMQRDAAKAESAA